MMQLAATGYNLGPAEQVPVGEGKVFRLRGIEIAVFRARSGGVYATQARCPHRGGPLADGIMGGETVVCPLHGYRYGLRTGEPLGSECQALATFSVRVSERGDLLLEVP